MPIIGTSAYNTAGQATQLVRALLNDSQGNLFTDGLLLPYLNAAYRKVQRGLANTGAGTFIVDNVIVTVSAIGAVDPSAQVVINDATAPPNQLPSDLLVPVKLWERTAGSSDDFSEMADLTSHGGLPSRPQGLALDCWEWRGDGIYFCGATQDNEVRIRYQKAYPDLADATSPVLIRGAQDAIAYFTAAMASMSRGSPLADKWTEAGDDALEDLLSAASRREQNSGRRRRPYSSRRGYVWL
jgi:hypothetical protein